MSVPNIEYLTEAIETCCSGAKEIDINGNSVGFYIKVIDVQSLEELYNKIKVGFSWSVCAGYEDNIYVQLDLVIPDHKDSLVFQ